MPRKSAYLDINPQTGVETLFHRLHDGDWAVEQRQDIQPIADANAEVRNHIDTTTPDKSSRLTARIPMIYRQKWINDYGLDFLSPDPDVQRRIDRLLDDPAWSWMKTTDGKLY